MIRSTYFTILGNLCGLLRRLYAGGHRAARSAICLSGSTLLGIDHAVREPWPSPPRASPHECPTASGIHEL
jgi:hypothetical protein